jgi:hypothetical protein
MKQVARSVMLVLLAAVIGAPALAARSKVEWQTYTVPQLKAAMSTLGVGEHARVIVTLQDGTRLTGYVSQADDTHFVVVANGQASPVEFDQVADIRAGNPDTQVKFAARITSDAALAAGTPPAKPSHQHQRLSAAAKAALVLAVTAGGIVLTLALFGKL